MNLVIMQLRCLCNGQGEVSKSQRWCNTVTIVAVLTTFSDRRYSVLESAVHVPKR